MRVLSALAALVALGSGTGSAQPSANPIVIIVHGRGHLDGDSATLRRVWKRDVDSSLAAVGLPRLLDADLRLAWYADVLDPRLPVGCAVRTIPDSASLDDLALDFLASLALALPRNESREARTLIGDLLYVADEARRCAARQRVAAAIEGAAAEGRPVIVVAYSLGSVVAYGALHSRAAMANGAPAVRFITIGSPLGNPEIRELLGHGTDSLRAPAGVASWENVYDPNDAFASALGDDVAGRMARDRVTTSDAADPHYIGRYLRDRATAGAVGRALCALNGTRSPACTQLWRE